MTDDELRELRELLVDCTGQFDLEPDHLPPRVWVLVGLPDKAIEQLRHDAARHHTTAHYAMNGEPNFEVADWHHAKADVLEAEANLLEAKSRLRDIEKARSERPEVPEPA